MPPMVDYLRSLATSVDSSYFLGVLSKPSVEFNSTIGICASIRACTITDDKAVLTAKGQYRFHIIDVRTERGINYGTIRILPEDAPCSSSDMLASYRCSYKGAINPFPPWVYKLVCPYTLSERAMNLAVTDPNSAHEKYSDFQESVGQRLSPAQGPKSNCVYTVQPVQVSYSLSANLPLSDIDRLQLLEEPNVVTRLRKIIRLCGSMSSTYACGSCHKVLASHQALFTVPGAEGRIGAYCNPQVSQPMHVYSLYPVCNQSSK